MHGVILDSCVAERSSRSRRVLITNVDGRDRSVATLELSRSLVRALGHYSGKVEAMAAAESDYRHVVAGKSLRNAGRARGKSEKRVEAVFDALVDAVVELQRGQHEVVALAECEGVTLSSLSALDPAYEAADREYAGYLAARTYGQVRETVEGGAIAGHRAAARSRRD